MSSVQPEEESKDGVVFVKLQPYEKVINKTTVLYSTYEPEYILKQLTTKL